MAPPPPHRYAAWMRPLPLVALSLALLAAACDKPADPYAVTPDEDAALNRAAARLDAANAQPPARPAAGQPTP